MCDGNNQYEGHLDDLRIYKNTYLNNTLHTQIYTHKCHYTCKECQPPQNNRNNNNNNNKYGPCLTCQETERYFEKGYCICPNAYYDSEKTKKCEKCPKNC